MTLSPRARKLAVSTAVCALGLPVAAIGFGPRGLLIAAVMLSLWLAWRHDNRVGACLPLVVLMLIAALVLGLLLYLLMMLQMR